MAQEEAVSNQWSAEAKKEDTRKSAGATQIKKELPTLTLGHDLFRHCFSGEDRVGCVKPSGVGRWCSLKI